MAYDKYPAVTERDLEEVDWGTLSEEQLRAVRDTLIACGVMDSLGYVQTEHSAYR